MKYPYEVRFFKEGKIECMPCETLKISKIYLTKYAHEITRISEVWQTLTDKFPHTKKKVLEFNSKAEYWKVQS